MPYRCCVPGCRGNYDSGPKVHVFRLPEDEVLKTTWLRAIPRDTFQPTKHTRVCHVHFKTSDVLWETSYWKENGEKLSVPLKTPRLAKGAIPSIFPGCPAYMTSEHTSRECPKDKQERLEANALQRAIAASLDSHNVYESVHNFSNFHQFVLCNRKHTVSSFWDVLEREDKVIFMNLNCTRNVELGYCVVVSDQLELKVYFKSIDVSSLGSCFKSPMSVNCINDIHAVLEYIESQQRSSTSVADFCSLMQDILKLVEESADEKAAVIQFISSQLKLFQHRKERLRYSTDMIIFASLLHFISPHAYKFIRHTGNIILPHPVNIRKVCSSYNIGPRHELQEKYFLTYIREKVASVPLHNRYVSLMIDEIHIKPYFDFKGGNIVGMAYDSEKVANSAHVFMIQSINSPFKDVVHILPVNSLNAEALHAVTRKVILGLEKIGFKVICIVTDNNSINRKAMSLFANPPTSSIVYPHPADTTRPLFYVIDPVHILKCLRNNWINQKKTDNCMIFPTFEGEDKGFLNTASFSTLRAMYTLENDKLLKYGYGLSLKALWPGNLERQNVRYALQVFSRNVVEGLRELGPFHNLSHYEETAEYIMLIVNWWSIVNVKSPSKGKRRRDVMQEPMTSLSSDVKAQFLQKILEWLDRWDNMKLQGGTLSRETHSALRLSTYAFLELTSYCTSELGMSYILLGKFQTDALEDRFGQYRQLAGAQYDVSLRQVYEVEKKLRMSSVMTLELSLGKSTNVVLERLDSDVQWDALSESYTLDYEFQTVEVSADDLNKVECDLPIITYLAGYCAYSTLRKLKCNFCKAHLVVEKILNNDTAARLIRNLDRGGLLYPQQIVVDVVTHNYVIIKKLSSDLERQFVKVGDQRQFVTNITTDVLQMKEFANSWDASECNHMCQDVLKMIVWVSTNTLLKNYCSLRNDQCHAKKSFSCKRRKLQTFHREQENCSGDVHGNAQTLLKF